MLVKLLDSQVHHLRCILSPLIPAYAPPLKRLHFPRLCGADAKLHAQLLPLRAPRAPQEPQGTRRDWLAEITVALLQKAQELGLAEFAAERPPIASSAGILAPEGQVGTPGSPHLLPASCFFFQCGCLRICCCVVIGVD